MNFAINARDIALYLFSVVLLGCTGHPERTASTDQAYTSIPLPQVVPNCQMIGQEKVCNWIAPLEEKRGSQPAVNMVQRVPGIML
ncbi:hypothetical protein [Pseudomonas sp. RIT-PI-o]|uniref:hypothetical protein n=1 Tax=Pseudomonas sp. RIT-PI-o TaxID=1690246 RepID=UPI0006CD53BB|nr:hypothetical protein [Pseudomonas sp. RIT-PI-o]KPG82262.1 hypothetical protein AEQ63_13765 [Pseudomonas sp. RIT-PI-o]